MLLNKQVKTEPLDTLSDEDDKSYTSSQENVESEDDTDQDIFEGDESEAEENKQRHNNDTKSNPLTFVCDALCDFTGEKKEDLPFTEGEILTIVGIREDGWWEAENSDNKRGLVPSTFLKVPEKIKNVVQNIHNANNFEKKMHWDNLRTTVKQIKTVDTALHAFGAFPIGFCYSTLGQLLERDYDYSMKSFLKPKINESGLLFQDIQWDKGSTNLKPEIMPVEKTIQLVAFRQIIMPSTGYDITSRHIRMCLHDGNKVLSNIHTVRAKWDENSPKIWTFNSKISSRYSCLEEGHIFIRSNKAYATLGILFELCVTYKNEISSEIQEMSCGWVFMRLLNDSGLPIPNRNKVLKVHSGIPFSNPQDSTLPVNVGTLKHFMNRTKVPRMVVTISNPKRSLTHHFSFLPTTLIGPVSGLPILALYRKIISDDLLHERISSDSIGLIHSPFFANFPCVFNEPDLADAIRKLWGEKLKRDKLNLRKDHNKQKAFRNLFLETVLLISSSCNLPPYIIGSASEKDRRDEIARLMKIISEKQKKTVGLSAEIEFKPISIQQLACSIIG